MSLGTKHFYDFENFRVDPDERVLLRDGKPVPLTPKAFHMLVILVQNHGHIIDKEKLLSEVWADSFVEEGNLSVNATRLRKALADDANEPRYIETVARRGYRFIAKVQENTDESIKYPEDRSNAAEIGPLVADDLLRTNAALPDTRSRSIFRSPTFLVLCGFLVIAASLVGFNAGGLRDRLVGVPDPGPIKSLAVLPLKSLNRENSDKQLGLGIADTIIAKVSQVNGLIVRPTSAVSKFADQEIDSLEAARQMQVDAVLDGTFLREGERLRVSVNLLRVQDGASLWTDSFDMPFADIFTIQDKVSKQLVNQLRLKLAPAEQARLIKRYTTNAEAYAYYAKSMYHFSKRGFSGVPPDETLSSIDLLKRAIELDPNYALARAQLGFAYAWKAEYHKGGPEYIAMAKEELRLAEQLEPQLAEVHLARSFIAWSHFGNWQTEEALREALLAKELGVSIPNIMLASLYFHIGLEEQGAKEFEQALEQDPGSDILKLNYPGQLKNAARPDDWLALSQRLVGGGPNSPYYLLKMMPAEAAPLVEEEYAKNPDAHEPRRNKALLLALQGKHKDAQAAVPGIMETVKDGKNHHHATYDVARIYAQGRKSDKALKWLRLTAQNGFPCYTLFARDPYLDPIRNDAEFVKFLSEMKTRWEGYLREFG